MRAALIFCLCLLPFAALAQDTGVETPAEREDRGRIVAFLEDNLSGAGREVILRGFEGALSSTATATQLTIADSEGIWLTLNDITLDWSRSSLLRGVVSVTDLSAAEIIVARAPVADPSMPTPEARGFALPDLPVAIEIEKIEAKRVVLGESLLGQAVEGTISASLNLSGGEGNAALTIARTDDGPAGTVDLTAAYSNANQTLSLALNVTEQANGIAATLLNLPGRPSVDLQVQGDGPLDDFAATLALRTDGADRLTGDLTVKGNTDTGATRFVTEISGNMAPLFLPEYSDFFGDNVALQVQADRAATGRLDISRLSIAAASVQLAGSASIAPDGLPLAFALKGTLGDPAGGSVLLPGANGEVSLQSADIDIGYDAATNETWRATISARNLATPQGTVEGVDLKGSGRIARTALGRVVGGTITAQTSGVALTDPALAQAVGPQQRLKTIVTWAEGSGDLRIAPLEIEAGSVTARVAGTMSGLQSAFRLAGRAEVQTSDLSRFSALAGRPLSGKAVVIAEGQGSPLGGDFNVTTDVQGTDLTIGIAEVDGLLRGPSVLSAHVIRDATGTEVRRFAVDAGALSANGKGMISTDTTDLDFAFSMADLGALGPEYSGRAQGTAQISGSLATARASLTMALDGTDLAVGIPQVDRALAGASALRLDASLADQTVQVNSLTVTTNALTAAAKGTLAQAGSDITAQLALANLQVIGSNYGGSVAADLAVTGTPDNASITLSANAQGLAIGQTETDRVLAGATQLNAVLRYINGAVRIDDLQLRNPQLTLSATGRVDGAQRDIDLTARLANLGLLAPEFAGPVTVQGTASETSTGYQLDLAGTGPGQIDGRISGTLAPNLRSADLTIRGTTQAGLANPFLGNRVISGPVSVNLALNGPLALSSLSGRIALSQGRLADPALPFTVQNLNIAATLAGGQARVENSAAISTGGTVVASGTVGLSAPFPADLTIGLQSVVLRDPELYETRANGQLRLTGPLTGGAVLAGRIALPETEIRVSSTGLGGATTLEGLTHINEPAPVRETRRRAGLIAAPSDGRAAPARPLGLNVVISAPNRLFIRGRGLDAELGGELLIAGTTANIIPSGAFNLIRGRLDILGQRITLSQASLQLEGDFDPTISVIASTEANGIVSSVIVSGSASDPEVTFSSNPELPEEEVLAQLLFGRQLDQLSAFQALQLANAVATLAGRGGDGIVSRLRQGFGLDDLDVQTDDAGNAQLKAGKYLSENLYSEVVVDQTGKSQINLNLDVTDNLTVKGRVGADGNTGIGLFFEKDY